MKYLYRLKNLDNTVEELYLEKLFVKGVLKNNDKFYIINDLVDGTQSLFGGDFIVYCNEIHHMNCNLYKEKLEYVNNLTGFLKSNNIEMNKEDICEESIKKSFLTILKKDFEIVENEYTGEHFSGKKVIIDSIIKPKDYSNIKNKNLSFGIEFKNPFSERKDHDIIAQCFDYTYSNFPNYENMIILLCPILPFLLDERNLTGFVGKYNTGFIKFYEDELVFTVGNQMIYSSKIGFIGPIKKTDFNQKWGNRGYKGNK